MAANSPSRSPCRGAGGGRANWRFVISLIASCAIGCGEESTGPASAQSIPEPELPLLQSVKRPEQRHVMVRTGERCEILVVHPPPRGDELVSEVACPLELELGESIRMSGMTCLRESPTAGRTLPVACPSKLIKSERAYRERAAASARP